MARFSRIEVATSMYETGIVPVFYHADLEVCKKVLKACYDGGIRVFEFTNRADFAFEVFRDLSKYTLSELPGMILGIGSVIDAPTAAMFLELGANFIVSPLVDEETAKICNKRKIAWAPGCGTVTEVDKAHQLGAEVVKIFPGAAVGGPAFVKGLLGPMPWTSVMPTGGVQPNRESLEEWFGAGVHCVGIGSQLFSQKTLESGDYQAITSACELCIAFVQEQRAKG